MSLAIGEFKEIQDVRVSGIKEALSETLDEAKFFSILSGHIMSFVFGENEGPVNNVLFYKACSLDDSFELIAKNGLPVANRVRKKEIGIVSYVARTKTPYFSNDIARDPLFSGQANSGIKGELAIPLSIDNIILGVLLFQTAIHNGKSFADSHISMILDCLESFKTPLTNMQMYLTLKNLNEHLLEKIGQKKENNLESISVKDFIEIEKPKKEVIVARSIQFQEVLDSVERKAYTSNVIVLKGLKGVGKKLLSKKIHLLSNDEENYISIDIGRMLSKYPGFGEEKFQIIIDELIEIAKKGTLVFTGVADIEEDFKRKLAVSFIRKFIAQNEFRPVIVHFEGIELFQEFESLSFDLVDIPDLYSRKEDIIPLAEHFLKELDSEVKMTGSVIEMLENYDWPHNSSELKEYLQCAYTMTGSKVIDVIHLPDIVKLGGENIEEDSYGEFTSDLMHSKLVVNVDDADDLTLATMEKKHICLILEKLKGNKTRAAKALGITVKTLYNKLHLYGMVK